MSEDVVSGSGGVTPDLAAPDPAAGLRRAAVAGDADTAAAARERLRADPLPDLLDRLATAVEDGRRDDARLLLGEVAGRYRGGRPDAAGTVARAEAARRSADVEFDGVRTYTGVVRTASRTGLARGGVLGAVAGFLDAPGADATPDRGAVVDRVVRLRDRERRFETTLSAIRGRLDDVSVPPTVVTLGTEFDAAPVEVGRRTDLAATVANVGDGPATGVVVEFAAPEGLDTSTPGVAVGRLPPGRRTVSVELTGEAAGTYSLSVEADSDDAGGAVDTALLTVAEDVGPRLARFDADDSGRIEADEVLDALDAYAAGDPVGGRPVTARALLAVLAAFNGDDPV